MEDEDMRSSSSTPIAHALEIHARIKSLENGLRSISEARSNAAKQVDYFRSIFQSGLQPNISPADFKKVRDQIVKEKLKFNEILSDIKSVVQKQEKSIEAASTSSSAPPPHLSASVYSETLRTLSEIVSAHQPSQSKPSKQQSRTTDPLTQKQLKKILNEAIFMYDEEKEAIAAKKADEEEDEVQEVQEKEASASSSSSVTLAFKKMTVKIPKLPAAAMDRSQSLSDEEMEEEEEEGQTEEYCIGLQIKLPNVLQINLRWTGPYVRAGFQESESQWCPHFVADVYGISETPAAVSQSSPSFSSDAFIQFLSNHSSSASSTSLLDFNHTEPSKYDVFNRMKHHINTALNAFWTKYESKPEKALSSFFIYMEAYTDLFSVRCNGCRSIMNKEGPGFPLLPPFIKTLSPWEISLAAAAASPATAAFFHPLCAHGLNDSIYTIKSE